MSKFTLQYEEHYSFSPDLEKYFVPFNNDRFQECLDNRRKYTALMSISSQFNQDKTTLIATNNPLPDLTLSPQVDTPMKFFTKEQVGKSFSSKSQIHFPVLKRQPNQLLAPRNSLAVGKVGKPLQFRFSTDTDFKSEGQFSRNYAEKRMKRLYPHLHFHTLPGLDPRKGLPPTRKRGLTTKGASCQWEPLTLSSLIETQSAVTAPSEASSRSKKAS
ncbi:testis-specific gene 13 protein isoform X2 [Alligator sinensis]|uniref:Testis-specific gene 13 protein isoform X2 n=1 Tax=Alligator sinensis TaxID=38654 RepID=A0A1U8DG20_ALLSI|nr:testis-specific gene 13 protein isoform X2 [Alligator sinensis]